MLGGNCHLGNRGKEIKNDVKCPDEWLFIQFTEVTISCKNIQFLHSARERFELLLLEAAGWSSKVCCLATDNDIDKFTKSLYTVHVKTCIIDALSNLEQSLQDIRK